VLLALSMFGLFELALPSSLQSRLAAASNQQSGGRLWGVVVMGFLSALIVGPCVAPPLMAALIVIGASGDAVLGGSALFALSMGMGLPLIVFGASAGKLLPKAGPWMNAIKAVFGVGMLALAIWLMERILPAGLVMLLWGLLASGAAFTWGRWNASSRPPLETAVNPGLVLLLAGALEWVSAASGGNNWMRPLHHLRLGGSARGHGVAFRASVAQRPRSRLARPTAAASPPCWFMPTGAWNASAWNATPFPGGSSLLAPTAAGGRHGNDEVDQSSALTASSGTRSHFSIAKTGNETLVAGGLLHPQEFSTPANRIDRAMILRRDIILLVSIASLAGLGGALLPLVLWTRLAIALPRAPGRGTSWTPRPDYTQQQRLSGFRWFDGRWCWPILGNLVRSCREMPMLVKLHEAYQSRARDRRIAMDEVEQARNFAAGLGVDYPILVGTTDVMAVVREYGNVSGVLPYTVLLDRDGIIRWVYLGELKEEEVTREIIQLLE
jgi:hypothetical protein